MSDTVKKPRTPKKPKTTKVQKMDISKKDPDKPEEKHNLKHLPIIGGVILLVFLSKFGMGGFGPGLGILPGGQGVSGQQGVESLAVVDTSVPDDYDEHGEITPNMTLHEETFTEAEATIIKVTVNEDGYLFHNQKYTLEEIFGNIKEGDEIHYIVQRGSKDDVDDLVNMAKQKGIKIIKED